MSTGGFYVIYTDDGFWTDFNEPTTGVRGEDWDECPDMASAMLAGYARIAYVKKHTTGFQARFEGKTRKYKTMNGVLNFFHKNPEAEVYRETDRGDGVTHLTRIL